MIPKVLHRVWVGDASMPEEFEDYWDGWRALHPKWILETWREADLAHLPCSEVLRRASCPSQVKDVVAPEILVRHGGVYVDCDFEPLAPLDELLKDVQAFAASESSGVISTGIMGCVPGHEAFKALADYTVLLVGVDPVPSPAATGPGAASVVLRNRVTVYGPELFYPYLWGDGPERAKGPFPGAYAVHRWAGSWIRS